MDFSTLPISGGIIVAGALWAGISAFALGPLVVNRMTELSGWNASCEAMLDNSTTSQTPPPPPRPSVGCSELMGLFGNGADQLCDQGGDTIFNLLTIDPLAAQKDAARERERTRLARIAELTPSRCSCATKLVRADRVRWGLYAGSARIIGGSDDLLADLNQALHSPACDFRGED
jgi:hypothetical protein